MTRRSASPSGSSPRPAKRQKVEHLTSESFKNGVMLAPMVRSGALPTRLFALKYGAKLVWSPEIVDKAILHAERVVDPVSGVVSYNGKSKAIFTTHPVEKPYLVYQIGSADPETAVQAAKTVMQDVSGIDLNCGCPKPFSTHSGMGAALLTNPDLLCNILTALRAAMPPEITVSAKIRLLPDQADTLKLVERIVNTGVSALTVHCRTRNMRPRERALIERLKEIVDFVEGMGRGVAVIANGDCLSAQDALRVREITGAHSCMIATAAESNPSCFSQEPLEDLEKTFVPQYIRLGKYLDNHFSNTKFCMMSFKGKYNLLKKHERTEIRDAMARTKSYEDCEALVDGLWTGEEVMNDLVNSINSRGSQPGALLETGSGVSTTEEELNDKLLSESDDEPALHLPQSTPPEKRENPEPVSLNAPLLPRNERLIPIPAAITGIDVPTPSSSPVPHVHS
ncbi:FMN-linked oxidoreductase [Schizopora paradoxa]|uniref:FMN-linked oxidoreductase n=1 Tax=Schizopora paradoxa TaxID=27342 RepID=A0A0H2SSR5_9AGAM|nr:FMN-linked oxidoreductase [Schizopora paradoxa]